jgi:drug/metabolite transporter (DMT)-like permease
MDPVFVAAALLSAFLHAAWNAAVKASARPAEAMTAQMIVSAVLSLPGLAWAGLPAAGAWGWIAASTILVLIGVSAILRAYESAGFAVAYPLTRAISVMLVVPLAVALAGETLSAYGLAGIGLIALSLVLLAGTGRGEGTIGHRALGWIALAGVALAAEITCAAQGVRASGSSLAYGCAASIVNAAVFAAAHGAIASPVAAVRPYWRLALPVAAASMTSYLLILWVWAQAPIAPSAALRDASAAFAVVIAVVWLREPLTRRRLLAVLATAAAVPLLRLA